MIYVFKMSISSIYYTRLLRTEKLDLTQNQGSLGKTSFGRPHYDLIHIDGVAFEAYSCGCPKMIGLPHDPYPIIDFNGNPKCPTYTKYRNNTYHPDMDKTGTTTLQCGCRYNYYNDDYGPFGPEHYNHSPEKCLEEKARSQNRSLLRNPFSSTSSLKNLFTSTEISNNDTSIQPKLYNILVDIKDLLQKIDQKQDAILKLHQ